MTVRATLLAIATTLPLAAFAIADTPQQIDIPAGDLSQALLALSKQTGTDLVYPPDQVHGLTTQGVHGELTSEQAVNELLKGTPLELTVDRTGAIFIAAPAATPVPADTHSSRDKGAQKAESFWSRFRMAQIPAGAASSVSSGNEGTPSQPQVEEVVVTAQKREQRLIDVPISVVALSSDELDRRKATSIDDLVAAVPGMSMQSNGYQRRAQIRGVSNSSTAGTGNSSLIGVYLDEADVTSSGSTQLGLSTYDLERVEVLRGPQGTLYGNGSAGGTIRFITKSPSLDRLEADADVQALFTENGGPSQRINAMLNVPLATDVFGLRLAGSFEHMGGWVDQPSVDRKNINSRDLSDVRVKALWRPASQLSVSMLAEVHRNDATAGQGEDVNGNYTQKFGQLSSPSVQDDFDIYNVTVTYDFGSMRLLNSTSYVRQVEAVRNFGYSLPFDGPRDVTPAYDVLLNYPQRVRNVNEELRLSSTGESSWQWTIGGYYRDFRYTIDSTFYFDLPGPLPQDRFTNFSFSHSKAWAAFGDSSYALTDRLTIGAGLRYYEDDQDYTTTTTQSGKFDTLSPRAYVQLKLSEDANLYASSSKGFRSGGFNSLGRPRFDPETVWTHELGLKLALLDNRLSINTDVFHTNYSDYQVIGLTAADPVNIVRNAGDARIQGFEWDIVWRPSADWALSLNGSALDHEFRKVSATNTAYVVGDELDLVPDLAYAASAQRDFTLQGRPAFVRLDFSRQGRTTFRNRNIAGPSPWYFSQSDVIGLLNLNVGVALSDHMSLGLFGQNLLDDDGYVFPGVIEEYSYKSRPRTLGLEISASF